MSELVKSLITALILDQLPPKLRKKALMEILSSLKIKISPEDLEEVEGGEVSVKPLQPCPPSLKKYKVTLDLRKLPQIWSTEVKSFSEFEAMLDAWWKFLRENKVVVVEEMKGDK